MPRKHIPWLSFLSLLGKSNCCANLRNSGFVRCPIGNNAFDHNLGSWRDVPGIYFDLDVQEKAVVIADRGQGVRATLSRIEPTLENDRQALEIAFTRQISGRSPEQRGNGLKFVKSVIEKQKWDLDFFSGTGKARIGQGNPLQLEQNNKDIKGTIALVYV